MSYVSFCWSYLIKSGQKALFLRGLGMIIFDGLVLAMAPVCVGLAIAKLYEPGVEISDIWPYALLIALSFPLRLFAIRRGWTWGANAGAGASELFRNDIMQHMRRLPLATINRWTPAKVASLISEDGRWLNELMTFTGARVIGSTVAGLLFLAVIFLLNVTIGLSVVLVLFFAALAGALGMHFLRKLVAQRNAKLQKASAQIGEYTDGLAVFRSFGKTGSALDQLRLAVNGLYQVMISWLPGVVSLEVLAVAILSFIMPIAICILAWSFSSNGWLSDDALVVEAVVPALFLVIAIKQTLLIGMIKQLIPVRLGMQAHRNISQFLAEKPLEGEGTAFQSPLDIAFDQVSFSYGADQGRVLDGISFRAKAGQLTAIVGPSGAGKTTIAALLLRFFEGHSGSIKVGGQDIASSDPEQLQALISHVGQDVHLFKDSLRANILFGAPEASEEELARVIAAAQLDEVIAALPNGLDSVLGGAGRTLSGGERQRIAIARALLKDAPILVFDEATSAMDPLTERAIQKAIAELWRDRTVIAIAHRLRTIIEADSIVVMQDGRVCQNGSHETLISEDGLYRDLWSAQDQAHKWRLR